jgi:hypothetical protein
MSDIEVRIFRNGVEIERVRRPLRELNGAPAITYRKQLRAVLNGNQVHLEGTAPAMLRERAATCQPDSTETPESTDGSGGWDDGQKSIISAPPEARLLGDAGPGTGKTAVACARVAELIEAFDIQPGRIWIISFTRTAVREIRDRIAGHLTDPGAAHSVKIATLDSHAWALHSGFDEEAALTSYESNIDGLLALLRDSASLRDYLLGVEHLIVDEAQDIVGSRADLIVELLLALSPDCGITVLADEAQAIYGFSSDEDNSSPGVRSPALPERLRDHTPLRFTGKHLTQVHRTSSSSLLSIFTETRRRVLDASTAAADRYALVRSDVCALAQGEVPPIEKQDLSASEQLFILYRRRSDVLMASAFLGDIPHRIRMSGTPVSVAPWVGAALSAHISPDLTEHDFREAWARRVAPNGFASCPAADAWKLLVRLAGRSNTVVDMKRLRKQLSRRQPPADICSTELGMSGPILGTIHASKGREADVVHLMLPAPQNDAIDHDEEARVVFVAATRGRKRLLIGNGYRKGAGTIEPSGRTYRILNKDNKQRVQIEIGRIGDIAAEGLAGRSLYADARDAAAVQEALTALNARIIQVSAKSDPSRQYRYRLIDAGGHGLGFLETTVNDDLFRAGELIRSRFGGSRRKPPELLPNLRIIGVRTHVVPPDGPEAGRLHEPWASSGIMLAPVVIGFMTVFLPFY